MEEEGGGFEEEGLEEEGLEKEGGGLEDEGGRLEEEREVGGGGRFVRSERYPVL